MSRRRQSGVIGYALLLLLGGCGARASSDAQPNPRTSPSPSAGASGTAGSSAAVDPSSCSGDLTIESAEPFGPPSTTARVQCATGIVAEGLGLGRLEAASANADRLQLDFPALQSGSYTLADCARARLWMDGGLYDFTVFGLNASLEPQVTLNVERGAALVTGSISAGLCRQTGERLMGDVTWPLYDCVRISIPNFRARVESGGACECPSSRDAGGNCEVGVCLADGCSTVSCPWNSAICAEP